MAFQIPIARTDAYKGSFSLRLFPDSLISSAEVAVCGYVHFSGDS